MKKRFRKGLILFVFILVSGCIVTAVNWRHWWRVDRSARVQIGGEDTTAVVYSQDNRYLVIFPEQSAISPGKAYVIDARKRFVRQAYVDNFRTFRRRADGISVWKVWGSDDFMVFDTCAYQRDLSGSFSSIAEDEIPNYDAQVSIGVHGCSYQPVFDTHVGHRYVTPVVTVSW